MSDMPERIWLGYIEDEDETRWFDTPSGINEYDHETHQPCTAYVRADLYEESTGAHDDEAKLWQDQLAATQAQRDRYAKALRGVATMRDEGWDAVLVRAVALAALEEDEE